MFAYGYFNVSRYVAQEEEACTMSNGVINGKEKREGVCVERINYEITFD